VGDAVGDDGSTWVPESLLAGVGRLSLLGEGAPDRETVFHELARELLLVPGAEEVHVHHLAGADAADELVAVYLFGGEGRLAYLLPRAERPPGVSWVASSGQRFLVADDDELAASVPRLAETGEMSSALLLPLAVRGQLEAVVILVRRLSHAFGEHSIELAATLVKQAATALALVRARTEAGTDPVAGCMNHRAMRRRLDEEIDRATSRGEALSCLLIDLDNFKLVNDRHGHQAGDAALRAVVEALVAEFRALDGVARYGGDEFVVILPRADLARAARAASRALEQIRAVALPDSSSALSASVGVAEWQAPMSRDALLRACDEALLRSKRQGKDRVSRAAKQVR
jgi:diguanylate cyclase (GGDEF)-like protein